MLANIFSNDTAWAVMWIAAVLSSLIGFGFLIHTTYITRVWRRTEGTVVGNTAGTSHHDSGSATVYFAEIQFRAHDGEDYTVRSDVGRLSQWPDGSRVTVYYKPWNPAHAMTMKLSERLIFSGFFIAMSLLLWSRIADLT